MDISIAVSIFCSVFSAPDFYLKKSRKITACKSIETIYKESKKNDVSPTLAMSMVYVESGWKKTAVSHMGACGLTQVIPKYTGKITKKYSCEQLKNPRLSIKVGLKTFRWWINYHEKNQPKNRKYTKEELLKRALCSYNAGFRCKGKKPSKGGMRYAEKIYKLKHKIESRAKSLIE